MDDIDLWSVRADALLLQAHYPRLVEEQRLGGTGVFDDDDRATRVYYQEILPYPDRLTSWLLVLHIDRARLTEPFRHIRLAILGGVVAGLLIGFVWEWFREHKQRAEAKAQRRERDQLAREVQSLRGEANKGRDEVLALLED